jgi:uncharacterized protein YhdP
VANIVAHSIHEDEYGVLQNDLKAVIADLARVSLAIDAYIRASGVDFDHFFEFKPKK